MTEKWLRKYLFDKSVSIFWLTIVNKNSDFIEGWRDIKPWFPGGN